MTLSVIIATTCMIQLKKVLDLSYIFIIIGSFTLLVAIFIFFGIKEPNQRESTDSQESLGTKLKALVKSLVEVLRTEWVLYIAFLANFCNKVGAAAGYTFGTLLVQDSFPPDEQSKADDAVSLILMISNLLVVPMAILVGKALDK
jgi:hypothetical protein